MEATMAGGDIHTRIARDGWSPEQIAGRLKQEAGGETIISFKSIYKYLYTAYGQWLCLYLRYKRYRPRPRKERRASRELIKNRVFIEERPMVINHRRRYGDFEGDTLGAPPRQIENREHETLGVPTYFCHPYSSWEKGTVEHAFWMLQKYIPKGKSLRYYTHERIAALVARLNHTPRKCLGYRTPYEVFKGQLVLPT